VLESLFGGKTFQVLLGNDLFVGDDSLVVMEAIVVFIVMNLIVMNLIVVNLIVMDLIVVLIVVDDTFVMVTVINMHGVDSSGDDGSLIVDHDSSWGHSSSVPCLDGLVDHVLDDWLLSDDTSKGLLHLVNDVLVVNLGNDRLDNLLDKSLLLNTLDGLAMVNLREGLFVCGLRHSLLDGSQVSQTESLLLGQGLFDVLDSVGQDGGLMEIRVLDVVDNRLLVNLSDWLLNDFGNQSLLFGVRVLLSMNVSENRRLLDSINNIDTSSTDYALLDDSSLGG